MKLFSAREMRAADEAAVAAGVPLLLLMEGAGRAVTDAALRHFPDLPSVLVLCGRGNNGGDGYVAARLLLGRRRVEVLELSDTPTSAVAKTMRDALCAHGVRPLPLTQSALLRALRGTPLVIDALFGSGLTRPLEDNLAELVEALNKSGAPVLSVDLPSGLAADSGEVLGPHVRATRTVQFAGVKAASLFYPARAAFGVSETADIGIPAAVLDAHAHAAVLSAAATRPHLPARAADTHKYEVGTVLVVAGSERYLGAAELACRAALRGGAGLVTLAAADRFLGTWPELIHEPLDWADRPLETLAQIGAHRAQVRVIGPGLDARAEALLPELIAQQDAPTVLDAGALAGGEAWFAAVAAHGRCVLTPHTGEAAKLLGVPTLELRQDALGSATALAERAGAVVVLKGATTVVAAPDGRVAVHSGGHPGMATGGTGDVLAGLLGAWCRDPETLFERACAGITVHALAGERAAEHYGDGLTASDLVEALPQAWLELR
jgi:ADP-dependent NAD(P)H-hydrate dehydratase / NAD(P)H-hydrate epimerase